jgi:hypothetical protein
VTDWRIVKRFPRSSSEAAPHYQFLAAVAPLVWSNLPTAALTFTRTEAFYTARALGALALAPVVAPWAGHQHPRRILGTVR